MINKVAKVHNKDPINTVSKFITNGEGTNQDAKPEQINESALDYPYVHIGHAKYI